MTQINRKLYLALGRCWHAFDVYYKDNSCLVCGVQRNSKKDDNPDYCADPRLVIEAMIERDDYDDFIGIIQSQKWFEADDWINLFMDKTGKLAVLAIELLGQQEGGGK